MPTTWLQNDSAAAAAVKSVLDNISSECEAYPPNDVSCVECRYMQLLYTAIGETAGRLGGVVAGRLVVERIETEERGCTM